ncbi:MAG: type II toxin-antitoxin system HicA family toxin [Acidobacteriaceae bacterium]|nr:type II toxin-antitoxin system HicA family toxin [Acidobacteriaceae bacterium]
MSRTPRVTGAELTAALIKAGFCVVRVRGSHRFLRPPGRTNNRLAHPFRRNNRPRIRSQHPPTAK